MLRIEILLTYFTEILVNCLLSGLTFTAELLQLSQNYIQIEKEA